MSLYFFFFKKKKDKIKDPGCFVRSALCLLAAWLQEGEKEA